MLHGGVCVYDVHEVLKDCCSDYEIVSVLCNIILHIHTLSMQYDIARPNSLDAI